MEPLNLNWHTYNDHLKEMMQNLMHSSESVDVTLVCEDRTKLKAHKFVLNACSPVFQSIINDLPQIDPVIYLRGVLAPEMKSILQFMYLGQASIYQDRINDFLNVAKSLEIKEISKELDHEYPESINDQEYDKIIEPNIGNLHEANTTNTSNVEGEIVHKTSKFISFRNKDGRFSCDRCDKHYNDKGTLHKHIQSAHEGIRFLCDDCGYIAPHKSKLSRHIQSIHDGVKFPCDLCDFKASRKDSLNNHKEKRHA